MKTILHMIIIQCDPDVIMLGWCYSLNGDVSMVLRSEGVFSLMILSNDLRVITANPIAELNVIQKQIIKEIGRIVNDIKDLIILILNLISSRGKA